MHRLASTTPSPPLAGYHAHVDGLRAIAILAVVASHIGLPGAGGGYVGVDIFFVISGFLIIGQIAGDAGQRRFSFGDFWSRRALRILPPLLVVLVACTALGAYVSVLPDQFHTLGQEALYAALMALNFLLAGQQGYFDALATTKPFLHLWSLAVEEQFYLAAPILIVFGMPLWRRWPGAVGATIVIGFAASLAACIYYSTGGSGLAFYGTPMRAWEFIAGGMAGALSRQLRQLPPATVDAVGWGGMALLAVAIAGLGDDASYPSYLAILPVAGAAAAIAAGLAYPEGTLAKALSWRPLVVIGLYSYAWYLWHWPLLVFAREADFGALPLPLGLGVAVLALGLAWLTHLGVERPIRRWRRSRGERLNWWPAVSGMVCAIAIGVALIGWGESLGSAATAVPRVPDLLAPLAGNPCELEEAPDTTKCLGDLKGARLGVLLGDSHAADAYPDLRAAASAHGARLATIVTSACPAILAASTPTEPQYRCGEVHQDAARLLSDGSLPIGFGVLLSYWQLYAGAGRLSEGRSRTPLGLAGSPGIVPDQKAAFVSGLRSTIALLQSRGAATILVIAPTPNFPNSAGDCLARARRSGRDADATCAVARAVVDADRRTAMDWLAAATAGLKGVRLADPLGAFCDAAFCHAMGGTTQLFYDNDHPTPEGERRLFAFLKPDFDWVLSPP